VSHNQYTVVHYLPSTGDLRARELHQCLRLLLETFELAPDLFGGSPDPIDWSTPQRLESYLKAKILPDVPEAGADDILLTRPERERDPLTCRFTIHVGSATASPFIDMVRLEINEHLERPSVDFLRESIRILRPFEAYIDERFNMAHIGWFERARAVSPRHSHPAFICGTHYFTADKAAPLGGIGHCLNAPAYNVERFADGIWIQLCESGWLDKDNPNDWRIQQEVMEFFGIW
jgi:hypothetical protein